MPSERIYVEIAMDESGRFNLGSPDPYCVSGGVVLVDGQRDRVREWFCSGRRPKWREATAGQVEDVLALVESLKPLVCITVVERTPEQVRRAQNSVREQLSRMHSVDVDLARRGSTVVPYELNPENFFHLHAFQCVGGLIAQTLGKALTERVELHRASRTTCAMTVFVGHFDAPEEVRGVYDSSVRSLLERYAPQKFAERGWRIEFKMRPVEFGHEESCPSLLLIDHLGGIVAGHGLNPGYSHIHLDEQKRRIYKERLLRVPSIDVRSQSVDELVGDAAERSAEYEEGARSRWARRSSRRHDYQNSSNGPIPSTP
ncbi:MAG: hypothetical protein HYY93_05255 [Planctomycetes bacterium]|nr:hypothetical protein [Planctomycetota bacterium]